MNVIALFIFRLFLSVWTPMFGPLAVRVPPDYDPMGAAYRSNRVSILGCGLMAIAVMGVCIFVFGGTLVVGRQFIRPRPTPTPEAQSVQTISTEMINQKDGQYWPSFFCKQSST